MSSTAGGDTEAWRYEVFLSFRGSDTRKTFTDILHMALGHAGIRVFRDDDELRKGDEIGAELFKGIDESKIYIPILSKGYADSKWCLKELALMVKYRREKGKKIIPIFYNVEVSDVKHQTGSYGEAFQKYEDSLVERNTIEEWKDALRFVAELKGCEVEKTEDGYQGRFIKRLVSEIFQELNQTSLNVTENLVGINDQVIDVMALLDIRSDDVLLVGICGMGGTGKTTLAKVIYNQISDKFEHCSHLADVKATEQRNGIVELQNQLIFNILGFKISDSDHAVKVISERFRKKKVLILLDDVDNSEQLGKLINSPNCFGFGSRIIVTTRNKFIFDKFKECKVHEVKELDRNNSFQLFCKNAFKSDYPQENFANLSGIIVSIMGGVPLSLQVIGSLLHNKHREFWKATLEKLRQHQHKKIKDRLMISYDAFTGYDKTIASYFWKSCGLSPEYAITMLVNLSLVKIDGENKLCMHDHLRDLGRDSVWEQGQNKGMSSRLWHKNDALAALKGKNQEAKNLKVLDLSHCDQLERSPEFPKSSILERLTFEGCGRLVELHPSIWDLKRLLHLNLSHCELLMKFPPQIESPPNNLQCLSLAGLGFFLKFLPEYIGDFKSLTELNLGRTHLKRLPDILGNLKNLRVLNLNGSEIRKLPPSIGMLEKLEVLDASECRYLDGDIPADIGRLSNLRSLTLDRTPIRSIPESICRLSCLQVLDVRKIQLGEMPPTLS